MDPEQFTDVSEAIQTLHRAMKNVMVFTASPLLALLTHSWALRAYNSTYIFRVSHIFI